MNKLLFLALSAVFLCLCSCGDGSGIDYSDIDIIDATYADSSGRSPREIMNINNLAKYHRGTKDFKGAYVNDICDCFASNVDLKALVKHMRLVISINKDNMKEISEDKEAIAMGEVFLKNIQSYQECKGIYSLPFYYTITDVKPSANMPVELKDVFEEKCSGIRQLIVMVDSTFNALNEHMRAESEAIQQGR